MSEENIFEKALEMCDYEVQVKYNYLDELLCEIDDDIQSLYEEIQRAKVDEEIAEQMMKKGFDARDILVGANKRRVNLKKKLELLENRYEVVYDMYDEMFINVLANLE